MNQLLAGDSMAARIQELGGALEAALSMVADKRAQADRLTAEVEVLKAGLESIVERFKDKLSLHKEDCFAYQQATKALSAQEQEG